MIFKKVSLVVSSALGNRRQKKAAIQSRRGLKNKRLDFNQLERRDLLATFVVNTAVDDVSGASDGLVSLREAIIASNTNQAFGDAAAGSATGDRIVFASSLNGLSQSLVNGEYEITDDLVITGRTFDITLDGANSSRIFNINTSETVRLTNLSLVNGEADRGGAILSDAGGVTALNGVALTANSATGVGGGGIFFSGGSLFATGLTATENVADGASAIGGAIYQTSGSVALTNTVIESNFASQSGGGIGVTGGTFFARDITLGSVGAGNVVGSAVELSGFFLDANDLPDRDFIGGVGDGGGIFIDGSTNASFIGGTVAGNSAGNNGGGIYNDSGRLSLSDVDIEGNITRGLGDAEILFFDGGFFPGDPFIEVTTAVPGSLGGGGIYNLAGQVSILNGSILSNNETRASGGAIRSDGGRVFVVDSEISTNAAIGASEVTGGTLGDPLSENAGGGIFADGAVTVRDSRVVGNSAENEGGGIFNTSGLLFVSGAEIDDNTSGEGGGIFNLAGDVRVVNGSTINSNFGLDNGGGLSSSSGRVFIADSEIAGNTGSRGGGIGVFGSRFDADDELIIVDSEIVNNIAEGRFSDAGGIFNSVNARIFRSVISGNTAESRGGGIRNAGTLLLSDVEVSSNTSTSEGVTRGGGIDNSADLTITNGSRIIDNHAIDEPGSSAEGGGIRSDDGTLIITDSEVSNNSSTENGGGIYVRSGRLIVTGSTIDGNVAGSANGGDTSLEGSGGGIHFASFSVNVRATIESTTISNNFAPENGGGIWLDTGVTLRIDSGSQIINNEAAGDGGGGIYSNGGDLALLNITIEGNSASGANGSGGGIFTLPNQRFNSGSGGDVFISESIVNSNTATVSGGAISSVGSDLNVVGSTFMTNSAGAATIGTGGAINIVSTSANDVNAVFRDSLVSGSTATTSGGAFFIGRDSRLQLENTLVRSNSAAGNLTSNGGGGIFNDGGDLRINESLILVNSATGSSGRGGGVYSTGGSIVFENSRLNDNVANGNGGGLAVIAGTTRFENAVVNRNIAEGAGESLGNGGAVYVGGSDVVFVSRSSTYLENESAREGGAFWNHSGSRVSLLDNNLLIRNTSGGFGGGVYNQGTFVAMDALFSANESSRLGGAVYTDSGASSFLTSVDIRNNVAVGLGGGLANFGELAVVDSFFANNSGRNGGAIAAVGGETTNARNTFVGNSPNDVRLV